MSSIPILASFAASPIFALAHFPINSPASKLSVANVISCASGSAMGVSSAITRIPAARAFFKAGITESFDAVINIPFAPEAMQFSIAVICGPASPSTFPAYELRSIPDSLAFASAPSFIFTKNGFVLFLVIKQAAVSAAKALVESVVTAIALITDFTIVFFISCSPS